MHNFKFLLIKKSLITLLLLPLINLYGDVGGSMSAPTIGRSDKTSSRPSDIGARDQETTGRFLGAPSYLGNVRGSFKDIHTGYSSEQAGSWSQPHQTNMNAQVMPAPGYKSFNTNRNFSTTPNYVEVPPHSDIRNPGRDIPTQTLDSGYDFDSTAPYGAPNTGLRRDLNEGQIPENLGYPYSNLNSPSVITQSELQASVSNTMWQKYLQLDPEGKALALQLASQPYLADKNQAVNAAYQQMQRRLTYKDTDLY